MGIFSSLVRSLRRRAVLSTVARLESLSVGEIMTRYVITVRPDDEVIKAATKMIAEDISCLVVIDGDRAVGVITERDFLRKVPLSKAVFDLKVRDVMSATLISVPSTTKLPAAVALMKEKGIRRLVVTEGNNLLGVITQTDFTRLLAKEFTRYPHGQPLEVGQIMSKDVVRIEHTGTVAEAKQRMLKRNVGAILITQKDQVAGIFTEYDIVMQFYDQHGKLVMNDISKYMRKYVRAVDPQTSIFAANRLMLEKNMRRLLIVEGTKVVGIMTQTDVCRHMYTHLDDVRKLTLADTADLRAFKLDNEIHGEFRGDHLKVYDLD